MQQRRPSRIAVLSYLVDLTGQLSNPCPPLLRMLNKQKSQVTRLKPRSQDDRPRQRQVHLSDDDQIALVDRYHQGALQRELAETYGTERRTVQAIVRRHGATKSRGLLPEQIDEAVRLYKAGDSLAKIGRKLGVDHGTVRARLLEPGVSMRSTAGVAR